MKILKIRRGYTTNSSGANDWLSPPAKKEQGVSNSEKPDLKVGEEKVVFPYQTSSQGVSNAEILGGFFTFITGLFLIRMVLRRWQQKQALKKYNDKN